MRFTLARGGELTVEEPGHHFEPFEVRAALDDYLRELGLGGWDIEEALANAKPQRAWFSPVGGWGHDCSAHEPGETGPQCEGMHPVILITMIAPAAMARIVASQAPTGTDSGA